MTCNVARSLRCQPLSECKRGRTQSASGLGVGHGRVSSVPQFMVGVGTGPVSGHRLSPRCGGERLRSITFEDLRGHAPAVPLYPLERSSWWAEGAGSQSIWPSWPSDPHRPCTWASAQQPQAAHQERVLLKQRVEGQGATPPPLGGTGAYSWCHAPA